MDALQVPHIRLLQCDYVDLFVQPKRWNFVGVHGPFWRLYWNDRRGAVINRRGQCVRLGPSNVALVPPHTVFSSLNRAHIWQLYMHFQVFTPWRETSARLASIPVSPSLSRLIHETVALLRTPPVRPRRVVLTAHALVSLTLAQCADRVIRASDIDPRILRSLIHIENNLGAVLTNGALARVADMSVNAFCGLFASQTGASPHAYARAKRIEAACLRLHFSRDSIKQIAEATGFCDRHHFSRVFKRVQGMGPAEFRRLHRDPAVSSHAPA
jgi:AraC-like DNA-binding protein